ncbi:MAG: hypothetical protein Q3974_00825 [Rothia sp. (in: high G+C Gram-positive bacteria)]|nr:hypothetical protein [Rothia sp. (in: high G+C Gram-positive bacteria)]
MSSIAIEKTDTHPAGTTKTGRRSRAVAKMLLVNRRSTIFLAVFLPLMVGTGLAATGLIIAASTNLTTGNLSQFYTENTVHQVVVSVAFAAVSFMTTRRNLSLILGMGFDRKSFWRGYARASATLATITTSLYALCALVEQLTTGYTLGWQVMAPSFDGMFMFADPLHTELLELSRFIFSWFTLLFIVQVLGAFLALAFSKWGAVITGICCILFLGILLLISRHMFGTIYYDLGLNQLFFPYYTVDNLGVNYMSTLDILAMMKEEHAPSYPFPLSDNLYYTGKYMLVCLAGIVFTYAIGAFLLKKTDLR